MDSEAGLVYPRWESGPIHPVAPARRHVKHSASEPRRGSSRLQTQSCCTDIPRMLWGVTGITRAQARPALTTAPCSPPRAGPRRPVASAGPGALKAASCAQCFVGEEGRHGQEMTHVSWQLLCTRLCAQGVCCWAGRQLFAAPKKLLISPPAWISLNQTLSPLGAAQILAELRDPCCAGHCPPPCTAKLLQWAGKLRPERARPFPQATPPPPG